jgi:hypothetical protein
MRRSGVRLPKVAPQVRGLPGAFDRSVGAFVPSSSRDARRVERLPSPPWRPSPLAVSLLLILRLPARDTEAGTGDRPGDR